MTPSTRRVGCSKKNDFSIKKIVQRSWFKNMEELHKEWTEPGVSASRTTMHTRAHVCVRTLLNHQDWNKKAWNIFCTLCHFIWKSRAKSLEEEWRGMELKLFQVKGEVSTVNNDLGFYVICWWCSTVFYQDQSQPGYLPECFPALTSIMEMLISFLQ